MCVRGCGWRTDLIGRALVGVIAPEFLRARAHASACMRLPKQQISTRPVGGGAPRRSRCCFFFLFCSRAISHARAGAGPCTHHHITAYEKGSSGSKSVTEFSLVCCLLRLCYDKKAHDVCGMVVIAWALRPGSGSGVQWRTRRLLRCGSASHETPHFLRIQFRGPYPFVDRRKKASGHTGTCSQLVGLI